MATLQKGVNYSKVNHSNERGGWGGGGNIIKEYNYGNREYYSEKALTLGMEEGIYLTTPSEMRSGIVALKMAEQTV